MASCCQLDFEIVGELTEIVTIAKGTGVRDRARLKKPTAPAAGASAKEPPPCGFPIAEYAWPKFTGTRPTEARHHAPSVVARKRREVEFAVCIDNQGYQASLELGKLYRKLPDKEAQAHGLVRIIDESGEDYAYSSSRFHSMKVPSLIERALLPARR